MPPTVLFLHGFTNTGTSWARVISALPERYRALAPDLRGHGVRSDVRPVTLDAVLDDLTRLDGLGAGSCILVGYSQGGRIALHAALRHGGQVDRLVLIGASPGLRDAGARARRREADERLAAELERSTIEDFARRWAQTPVLADQPETVRALADADRRRNEPEGLAAALRGLGTGSLPSLWPRLSELRVPVDLVVGARDTKFRGIAQEMLQELPRARLTVVSGTGHAVHSEDPEAVASVIAAGPVAE
jgi:2-succinyl-6-hydroxy-2,4-cyclohexadiene-1-carboxylate synthase